MVRSIYPKIMMMMITQKMTRKREIVPKNMNIINVDVLKNGKIGNIKNMKGKMQNPLQMKSIQIKLRN